MPLSAPPPPPPATLRLIVDTRALAANWRTLDRLSGDAATGAAVKADCYGLGVAQCVPALREAGCGAFFVAHWSEAAIVARHVDPASIAVLHGVITSAEVDYAMASGIVPVVNSPEQARLWNERGGGRCHLMIDTGINRLGIAPADLGDPAVQALDIEIALSHLACADEESPMNARQLAAFRDALPRIAHRRASLANGAGIALGEGYAFDLTRPGLALYGGVPRDEMAEMIDPVAKIEAAILQVRDIAKGETVGYNAQYTAPHAMRVATVSLGYADGFLRARGRPGHAALHHADARLPILGKVSMDMIVVDLSAMPGLKEGDWLEVPFDLPRAALESGLSQYELLTTIGARLRQT